MTTFKPQLPPQQPSDPSVGAVGRRRAIQSLLFGAGAIGLRSLVTGLPAAFLLAPQRASAAELCGATASQPQYLIFATSAAGDPLNCNVPGTYDDAAIVHAAVPSMAKTAMTLGSRVVQAAQVWANTSAALRNNLCFVHHATGRNAHPDEPVVLRLNGQLARAEMLPSYLARQLAPCLQTVQREPVVLGAENGLEQPVFDGRALPRLSPLALRNTLLSPSGPLATSSMIAMRDRHLDQLRSALKSGGNSAQLAFMDRLASSQQAVRKISQSLLSQLGSINNADPIKDQITAATVLIAMNVAPVITIHLPFGGDNHTDGNLAKEVSEHTASIANLDYLTQQLSALSTVDGAALANRVLLAVTNVFGRTLKQASPNGREHWPNHHVTLFYGRRFQPAVIGGVKPGTSDYVARGINSQTGAADDSGDIPPSESLTAVAKTLGAAVGIPEATLNADIQSGRVIRAALVP